MPIFEYLCSGCGSQFEHLALRSTPEAECPACHGRELEKMISVTSVSSPHTRRLALRAHKAKSEKMRTEWAHEEHKRFHSHDD